MVPLQNSHISTPSLGNNIIIFIIIIIIIIAFTPRLFTPTSSVIKWGSETVALVQGLLSATSTLQRLE